MCNILKGTYLTLLFMKNVFVIDHTFLHSMFSYLDDPVVLNLFFYTGPHYGLSASLTHVIYILRHQYEQYYL